MVKVRLINRNTNAQMFPVCGKSRKLYGQAVFTPQFGGPIFEMSLEDYERDKFDLIGNTEFQQQWVPEFYQVETEITKDETENGFRVVEGSVTELGDGTSASSSDPAVRLGVKPRKERTITQRAKVAGVWKRGMTEDEMKVALGFPE